MAAEAAARDGRGFIAFFIIICLIMIYLIRIN